MDIAACFQNRDKCSKLNIHINYTKIKFEIERNASRLIIRAFALALSAHAVRSSEMARFVCSYNMHSFFKRKSRYVNLYVPVFVTRAQVY